MVVLPPPVDPTSAMVCPRRAAIEKPLSTGTPSRYQKSTDSKRSSEMRGAAGEACAAAPVAAPASTIAGSVASSDAMRSAALDAPRMSAKRCASSCTGCANSAANCMKAISVPSEICWSASTQPAPCQRTSAPAVAASIDINGM